MNWTSRTYHQPLMKTRRFIVHSLLRNVIYYHHQTYPSTRGRLNWLYYPQIHHPQTMTQSISRHSPLWKTRVSQRSFLNYSQHYQYNFYKKYRLDNRDILNTKARAKITCECGSKLSKSNLTKHRHTTNRIAYLSNTNTQ